ncbi:hypothetical protein SD37_33440 [Amycolatopsis orientalis]|uniref:Uncharacterized protein n=1 Tax=Amycolatopsis orientalis TaxID=31958 RepID=A0A193C6F8_AMYOR|nr:hypothetical protein [Amycolatopsis orientalis]ANN20029.1 hypothetical protein SD37_33440 [Amycolatopsis orientalis]
MERVVFDLPFPAAELPVLTEAAQWHRRWLVDSGLLDSPAAVDRVMSWAPHRCAAHFHPYARGPELLLATDFYGWMMAADGQFDGPLADRPDHVRRLIRRHVAILEADGRSPLSPAEKAFTDVWERLIEGMSPAWRARAAACFT